MTANGTFNKYLLMDQLASGTFELIRRHIQSCNH